MQDIALGIALLVTCAAMVVAALWTMGAVIDRWNTKRERAHQAFLAQCALVAARRQAEQERDHA